MKSWIFEANDGLWNLITYCAATGGSLLVIGSAAGVAFMGSLENDETWSLPARWYRFMMVRLWSGIGLWWFMMVYEIWYRFMMVYGNVTQWFWKFDDVCRHFTCHPICKFERCETLNIQQCQPTWRHGFLGNKTKHRMLELSTTAYRWILVTPGNAQMGIIWWNSETFI